MSDISFYHSNVPGPSWPVKEIKMYSDNTPMVKGYFPAKADSVIVRPDSLSAFVTAMFLVDSLTERGGVIRNLVLPYVPGARQDRINPDGDILFTAKSIAIMINDRNFDKVVVLDPHSNVISALIDRCVQYPLAWVAQNLWQGYSGVIAPDAGAAHRAEVIAKAMNKPLYQASKHRDVSTGKLSGFSVDVPAGGHYLVADDICDGGGTFVGLGEVIKESGSFADLYVSHGLFTKGTSELKKYYKNITTTDSIIRSDNVGLLTTPVVDKMKEYRNGV